MKHLLDIPNIRRLYEASISRMYGNDPDGTALSLGNRIGGLGLTISDWVEGEYACVVEGKKCIPMSTCDYLGLARNLQVITAATKALGKYGAGATGARVLTGNIDLYYALEERIAHFKGVDSCFVTTSAYVLNAFIIPLLFNEAWTAYVDIFAHASIKQGLASAKCSRKMFPHNDLAWLASRLNKNSASKDSAYDKVILVDALYSMQGTIVDLPALIHLRDKTSARLWVDEAHALGVLGTLGKGLSSYFGKSEKDVDFWVGTLSKAIPGIGGYICSSVINVHELLMGSCPTGIFSSAIPAAALAASIASFDILEQTDVHSRLVENIRYFKSAMAEEGFTTVSHPDSAVFMLEVGSVRDARKASDTLRSAGVLVHEVIFPALPKNKSALRLTVTAAHTRLQLESVVKALAIALATLRNSSRRRRGAVSGEI
jgi:7-keto-8-aminopelargonate synthetase-like enzyme